MDHRPKLVILALALCFCGVALAGYANVAPPASFTGNSSTGWFYKVAANDVSFANGVRGASGVINVGGRAVTMPAAFRFAANAGRIGARAVFLNPAWMVAVVAGSILYEYYHQQGFEVDAGVWKLKSGGLQCLTNCFEYRLSGTNYWGQSWAFKGYSAGEVGQQLTAYWTSQADPPYTQKQVYDGPNGTTAYWYKLYAKSNNEFLGRYSQTVGAFTIPPYDTRQLVPVTQDLFENTMAPLPIPDGVPQLLPDIITWPVELPILNPTPVPVPNPSPRPVPTPQPMRVPQGEPVPIPLPVPNPENLPQQWRTPVIDIVPSPTVSEPWRVDVQPKDVIKADPSPLPDSAPVPVTPPPNTTVTPKDTQDLCEKNPDILACQKFKPDSLDPVPFVNKDKTLTIEKDTGWGPSSGSCPAPKTVAIHGLSLSMPLTALCDFATAIKPFLLGFAYLSAALVFFGLGRKD